MLFYAGLLLSPSSISLYLSPQKTSDLRESHDPTRPGQGGHVPTRDHPWLRYCIKRSNFLHVRPVCEWGLRPCYM